LRFSVAGGIEVEENWDKVKTVVVSLDQDIHTVDLNGLLADVSDKRREITEAYVRAVYQVRIIHG
jgi:hypothetical protein